ncbi:MAG: hypothetical protein IAF94_05695 [Pirellulaceae bacterium]|nr:hypothetical protein [Pirellulaceae bacterium]
MPGFAPACPRCHSEQTIQVGTHDRYAAGASPVTSAPTSTVFTYKCKCGLAFTFEVDRKPLPPDDPLKNIEQF